MTGATIVTVKTAYTEPVKYQIETGRITVREFKQVIAAIFRATQEFAARHPYAPEVLSDRSLTLSSWHRNGRKIDEVDGDRVITQEMLASRLPDHFTIVYKPNFDGSRMVKNARSAL